MSGGVRDAIIIASELITFSVIISFIVYLGYSGYSLRSVGLEKQELTHELTEQRQLYQFDNRIATGDDILIYIHKYTKIHDTEIEVSPQVQGSDTCYRAQGGGTRAFPCLVLTREDSEDEWNHARVSKLLDLETPKAYRVQITRDPNTTELVTIQYTKEENNGND